MLDLDQLIFRTRALGQAHPFSKRAYAYVNRTVARQRLDQPIPELGIWAGHALTNGYCLRRVEEDEMGRVLGPEAGWLSDDLDEAATRLTALLRTDGAESYLLWPEERVTAALDRLIEGEVERRLTHWAGTINDEAWAEIAEYIAWWVVKGYALRVVEQLVGEDDS